MAEERVKRSSSQEKYDRFQKAIRILVLIVFLGWMFIWIIMPTNIYRQKWQPKLRSDTNSTFFGLQGTRLLIYTFPVLFIAALGSIFLHIAKMKNDSNTGSFNGGKHEVSFWKKSMLVRGPLGIVSITEVAFLVIFIALLVWSFASYINNSFSKITQKSAAAVLGDKVWEVKLASAGLYLGVVGNICLAFLFFLVARGSTVLPLLGLTLESGIKYHIWLGHTLMALFTTHGICFIIYWIVTHRLSQMLKWDKTGISNVAGEVALLSGLFLWVATIPRIRQKVFELFFYTHYLYIIFIVFFVFHVGISYSCIMLPGFYLFLVDRYLRFLQSRRHVRLVSARVLPCETLELNFSKSHGLSYNPTSVIYVNVPSISGLQWHPFTITSNSKLEPEKLSVVIKSEGSWSQKLYRMLSSSSVDRLSVSVEGPYGPASTNYLRHDILVMVSGGSGITPFISIIRELIYINSTLKLGTPKIILICAFKNSSSLSMLDLILPISSTIFNISNLHLQIEAYITRDKEPQSDISLVHSQSIWFKPYATDSPIFAILGPNNWLWVGAIISSSFIIYLILIAIITRYYIYPIDHNSNKIFSNSLRSFLNMLVICVSIAITATVAVLWNKRSNAKEAKQILSMEKSPTASSGSMIYNSDKELESLPQQSLAQAINVHYGRRPNLTSLLSEIKGSSVGVFTSCPKKMRQEVAYICSSNSVENFHFESISFTW